MTEIYLTKMVLNPQCNQVRLDIGNPQELHRTVSSGFPEIKGQGHLPKHLRETPRNKFDILHRLEIDRRGSRAALLVQSTIKPNWSSLPENYADGEIQCKAVHEVYSKIKDGMSLLFRLEANPAKRDKNKFILDKPKQRRRFAIITDEERTNWLARQGSRTGFKLVDVMAEPTVRNVFVAADGQVSFKKRDKDNPDRTHRVNYGSVIFEGVLQVTNADDFVKKALMKGIGQGKAYGFGLLLIAPIKSN